MLLNRETSGKRWRTRPDGEEKVTGKLVYLTDMSASGMLFGNVLRSAFAHARIIKLCTDKAMALPGVHAVLTFEDIPGLNGFGIAKPNQPVFCEDRVRYVGDAVAAVAADSEELADQALKLIEVEYEALPVIDDPEQALAEDAMLLHPEGNLLHRAEYRRGDTAAAFDDCVHIVEETYFTPRQMHTYMETEGGLFIPGENGRITVYSATQHGLMDRLQLSRITGLPESDIRVISSPIGGSFGGKDELNVQPYGVLLALRTGRPVKLHNSRKESVRAGIKRHPMKITMKTGVNREGKLLAHQVRIVADTGAYATLGAEVLNFALEHAVSGYRFENVEAQGYSVYTNNGVSGEFRGFGGNQAIFALEGQMDRLAELLGMDPWTFRALNLRQIGDPGPLGQRIAQTDGAKQVWEVLAQSPLWMERSGPSGETHEPWIRTGIGAALAMHGAGLGFGIPDPGAGRLALAADGKIEAIFGYEEFGQGLIATLEQMLIEQFGFATEDLRIVIGDTDVVPDSGSSTASRATSMMWTALRNMRPAFTKLLVEKAAALTGTPYEQLELGAGGIRNKAGVLLLTFEQLASAAGEPLAVKTEFHYPVTPDKRVGAHFLYTYAAVAVKVEVNTLTGRVKVVDQYHAVAAGPVVNPQGFLGQIEGGSGMALGFTLSEDAFMNSGRYGVNNLDTYLIPTVTDLNGSVTVVPIETLPEGDIYGPRGVGEIGSVALAPAITSAVHHAVGKRIAKLPIEPHLLQEAPFAQKKEVSGA
ncbi:xanthine dehydrogenase subunit D [Paenibacillus abyssi]|uniref:Xanthine dehydrogenase subunit D n=1 Tax=Paenibacillus abyssi TaxID=1340531 RepID=A0A917CUY2_9BACL|nr:xanthine dehydrogenase subunit D [Paenibacillus abyssi]GGF99783.1 putative xanthine dehydrogenase subunit D [Paenibacillus abyssi]